MASRYLIYRTDFGNTIVRESPTDNPTGGSESSFWSDAIIPEIQPLYLWRVNDAENDVEPNTDENINDWLGYIAPPLSPDDDATVGFVTGITENKMDKVTGATGNVGIFTVDGNLEDSGYSIADLTGGTSGDTGNYVTNEVFTGYTASTDTRLDGIDQDIVDLDDNKLDKSDFTGYTATTDTRLDDIEQDIIDVSGATESKLDESVFTGYTASTDTRLDGIEQDIIDVSGATEGKLDESVFTGYTASTDTRLDGIEQDIIEISGATEGKLDESVFTGYTATTDTRLDGIEQDIIDVSGETANKLDRNEFIVYTAATDTRLDGIDQNITDLENNKLDKSEFNQYTGDTDTRLDNIEQDITEISGITENAITGGTNGLTPDGRNLKLGGTLSENTTIDGNFNLNIDVNTLGFKSTGSTTIESQGEVDIQGIDDTGVTKFKLKITKDGGTITDDTTNKNGLKYTSDYNATFDTRSLIDKGYADAIASGLDTKPSVRVATTGETVDVTGGTFGGVVDGYTVLDGDRVLIKDQSNAVENGVYVYTASTNTFYRPVDFDNPNVTAGAFVFVETGATNAGSGWVVLEATLVSAYDIDVGSDPMYFSQFSSTGEYTPGHGININVKEISVDGGALDGDSINWNGTEFDIDLTTGSLKTALDAKLDKSEFNQYTGDTDTRLDGIEQDITNLDSKVEDYHDEFTGYTASTAPNELFLIHTGGTSINVTAGVTISWDSEITSGDAYSWSGGDITILDDGDYEINYNIPYIQTSNDSDIGIGGNILLTRGSDNSILDVTSAAGWSSSRSDLPVTLSLPSVIISLQANDVINLVAFKTAKSGTATTTTNGSIYLKKKNTP